MLPASFNRIRRSLLDWYTQNRRDLPWRRTRDPYAIWIAETMLQQTQVKTVLPYYRRFLKAFPTIQALDRASNQQVLARWSGLGYYRRAENLKKAARPIMREHGGKFPCDFDALHALPGIGPYTAGALMSIAFNQTYPAVDGNARRVLGRFFNLKTEREIHETAGRLILNSSPGELNQALMELGATICLAADPRCSQCPIARSCAARKSGSFELKISPLAKRKTEEVKWPLLLVRNNGRILFRRRPPGGLLGGLWELPGGEKKKSESLKEALARHLDGVAEELRPGSLIGEIRHTITHRRIRAPVFLYTNYKLALRPGSCWRWIPISTLERYPLSSLSLKAIRLISRR